LRIGGGEKRREEKVREEEDGMVDVVDRWGTDWRQSSDIDIWSIQKAQ
jgi:hypothetical protein